MSSCPTCGAPRKQRSRETHDHYFAAIQKAFENLPENLPENMRQIKDAERLRKWALVEAGYRDAVYAPTASAEEAFRTARLARRIDPDSVVCVVGHDVACYRARSQSLKAMGADEFQKSKDDVLRVLSELIGVDVTELLAA